MLQSLLMLGELVSFSLPWLPGVRETFHCASGVISYPTSKIHPGMNQLHAATSSAVMFRAYSLMTRHGTEYLRLFFVRRQLRRLSLACSLALSSFDHWLTHSRSTRSHDACRCISTPLGAHVCSTSTTRRQFGF